MQPFGHSRHGPNVGEAPPPFVEGAGSPCNAKSPGLRPTAIPSGILMHPTVWPRQMCAKNLRGVAPLGEGELGPRLTQCGHCVPSFILIHPTVWRQYTSVTDRTGRGRQTDRQWSESIGRAVLQTVAQKLLNIWHSYGRKVDCRNRPVH